MRGGGGQFVLDGVQTERQVWVSGMGVGAKESLENLFPFWEGGEEWLKWSGVTG